MYSKDIPRKEKHSFDPTDNASFFESEKERKERLALEINERGEHFTQEQAKRQKERGY